MKELLLKQEQELVFESFDHRTALKLGKLLIDRIENENLCIAFDISKPNQQLFYYAAEGMSADKDRWVKRKRNVVFNFGNSSFFIAEKNKGSEEKFYSKYGVSPCDYAVVGGSFPIRVKGCGLVAAFTVTGLQPEEDHQVAVDIIKTYLEKEANHS